MFLKLKNKLILNMESREFAEEIGITPQTFSKIQNNKSCEKRTALAIAEAYNRTQAKSVDMYDLFEVIEND